MRAVEDVLRESAHLTRDMGGKASTVELGKAIENAI
jgi:isocitrate/isopropylmalate dehydrogenase